MAICSFRTCLRRQSLLLSAFPLFLYTGLTGVHMASIDFPSQAHACPISLELLLRGALVGAADICSRSAG